MIAARNPASTAATVSIATLLTPSAEQGELCRIDAAGHSSVGGPCRNALGFLSSISLVPRSFQTCCNHPEGESESPDGSPRPHHCRLPRGTRHIIRWHIAGRCTTPVGRDAQVFGRLGEHETCNDAGRVTGMLHSAPLKRLRAALIIAHVLCREWMGWFRLAV
jgi:hypothetical protein